jgi:hypothetical protein
VSRQHFGYGMFYSMKEPRFCSMLLSQFSRYLVKPPIYFMCPDSPAYIS